MSIPKNACVSMKWDGRLPIGFNIPNILQNL